MPETGIIQGRIRHKMKGRKMIKKAYSLYREWQRIRFSGDYGYWHSLTKRRRHEIEMFFKENQALFDVCDKMWCERNNMDKYSNDAGDIPF